MPRAPSLAQILAGSKSESFRRLNGSMFPAANVAVPVTRVKRIRQSAAPMLNKLETRFHEHLLATYEPACVFAQAIRVELARSHWYKPDFFIAPHDLCTTPTFFETKGKKAFRGGFENLKVAARVHKWAKFFLVWEDGGTWKRQQVLP